MEGNNVGTIFNILVYVFTSVSRHVIFRHMREEKTNLKSFIRDNKSKLLRLLTQRVDISDIKTWDLSVLCKILLEVCNLKPELRREILNLRKIRNEIFHNPGYTLRHIEFLCHIENLAEALERIFCYTDIGNRKRNELRILFRSCIQVDDEAEQLAIREVVNNIAERFPDFAELDNDAMDTFRGGITRAIMEEGCYSGRLRRSVRSCLSTNNRLPLRQQKVVAHILARDIQGTLTTTILKCMRRMVDGNCLTINPREPDVRNCGNTTPLDNHGYIASGSGGFDVCKPLQEENPQSPEHGTKSDVLSLAKIKKETTSQSLGFPSASPLHCPDGIAKHPLPYVQRGNTGNPEEMDALGPDNTLDTRTKQTHSKTGNAADGAKASMNADVIEGLAQRAQPLYNGVPGANTSQQQATEGTACHSIDSNNFDRGHTVSRDSYWKRLDGIPTKLASDRLKPYITSLCHLLGKKLILADTANSKIKLIDRDSKTVVSSLDMDNPSEHVALYNGSLGDGPFIIVSLLEVDKLQLVKVEGSDLALGALIQPRPGGRCCDIAVCEKDIFVAYESPKGTVDIINKTGKVKKTLSPFENGDLAIANINIAWDKLYISKLYTFEVLCLTIARNGECVSKFSRNQRGTGHSKGMAASPDGLYFCQDLKCAIEKFIFNDNRVHQIIEMEPIHGGPISLAYHKEDEQELLMVGTSKGEVLVLRNDKPP